MNKLEIEKMKSLAPYQFHEHLKGTLDRVFRKCGIPTTVIEVGVYEGHSTFNMTHMFSNMNSAYMHYAIDPYIAMDGLDQETLNAARDKFDTLHRDYFIQNNIIPIRTSLKEWYPSVVGKIEADIIYIDGSHSACDVLEDLVYGWNLLKVGGAMICDDTGSWMWSESNGNRPLQKSPRIAVEGFINCNWDKIELLDLPSNWQTAFIKRC